MALHPLQSVNSRSLAALQLAIKPTASENWMKKFLLPVLIAMGFTSPAWADTEKDIVQVLASCLVENAPDNWDELSVHYSRNGKNDKGLNQVSVTHRVSAGGVTNRLEPCRPLIPAMLVEKLSATLPENSQQWKAVDIKIFKTGRFSIEWVQPEG
ncbi:hypothetical protein [Comamonas sp. 17RB]|uniref:hypothetical protein n=1 Tax=Comamonas sp. 17RB TaxID=3047025 RepID=UPI0024B842F5|nr:hypothetical protein [Comamonas sp. 17RB]MDI9854782.1 hypothetical protein [Comamonas sp. 17RB]